MRREAVMLALTDIGLLIMLIGLALLMWASWTGMRFRYASETSRKVTVRSNKRVRLKVATRSFAGVSLMVLGMAIGSADDTDYTRSDAVLLILPALLCCPSFFIAMLVGMLTVPGYRLFTEEEGHLSRILGHDFTSTAVGSLLMELT